MVDAAALHRPKTIKAGLEAKDPEVWRKSLRANQRTRLVTRPSSSLDERCDDARTGNDPFLRR